MMKEKNHFHFKICTLLNPISGDPNVFHSKFMSLYLIQKTLIQKTLIRKSRKITFQKIIYMNTRKSWLLLSMYICLIQSIDWLKLNEKRKKKVSTKRKNCLSCNVQQDDWDNEKQFLLHCKKRLALMEMPAFAAAAVVPCAKWHWQYNNWKRVLQNIMFESHERINIFICCFDSRFRATAAVAVAVPSRTHFPISYPFSFSFVVLSHCFIPISLLHFNGILILHDTIPIDDCTWYRKNNDNGQIISFVSFLRDAILSK